MIPREWTGRVWSLVLAAAGMFLTLCLVTYSAVDVGLLSSSPQRPAANLGGTLGAWIGLLGRGGFGWASLLVPLLCFLWAWRIWQGRLLEWHLTSFLVAGVCLMASLGTLLALQGTDETARASWGGITGFLLARAGGYYLGTVGTVLTALCAGLLSWLIVSGQTLRTIGQSLMGAAGAITALVRRRPGHARTSGTTGVA
ncbi:MAG: DNA translocase FtsK 4TM domain-containing protein, partial [Candidatus Omnitrophota bacterium]|nr:DNA translocase FtsK 4TM domain-containing protein [Candidatus Omnitrophota bacterium]